MLVLSRRVGEEVFVPACQLTVRVLDIAGSRVRLGFSAPAGVAILRQEILTQSLPDDDVERGDRVAAVRVLLADPDEFAAATYADCLRERGAIVTTASTGLECLERLQDFAPDVLVLEPELLWGGGDGVLAVIHEQPELRPAFVVLVSYARDRSLLHRVSRFKVDDYQVKPLSAARLANCLSRLLGSQPVHATLETAIA
jgi:carbon storage regulator CsrA